MLNSQEMKKITSEIKNIEDERITIKQRKKVEKALKLATRYGENYLYIKFKFGSQEMTDELKNELEKLGYTVVDYSDYDGYRYTIKW